jgi:hypothetical protein
MSLSLELAAASLGFPRVGRISRSLVRGSEEIKTKQRDAARV